MTRTSNARLAGFLFLFYIAIGITQMIIGGGATAGEGIAEKLVSIAAHATQMRLNIILGLVTCFTALSLAVALYALTREQDPDLAMLGLICRVGEGVLGAIFTPLTLGLISLVTTAGAKAPDSVSVQTLGSFLLEARSWSPIVSAIFFAVGSTFFCWLFLRGRMIPSALAWLGVLASVLLVVALPLQIAGVLRGLATQLIWIPMAAFEIPLGFWLMIKSINN